MPLCLLRPRRLEREQAQAEARATAERQAAIVAAQERERRNREAKERLAQQTRDNELASLRLKTARQQNWMNSVENAARNGLMQQQRQAVLRELDCLINPPPPPSEPEIIYVEPDEDVGICGITPIRWR